MSLSERQKIGGESGAEYLRPPPAGSVVVTEPDPRPLDAAGPAALGGDREVGLTGPARDRLIASVPANTRRAYARIWDGRPHPDKAPPAELRERGFSGWCAIQHRTALPASPQTLAEYVSHLCDRDLSPATIEQAIAGIRTLHRVAGHGRGIPDAELALRILKVHRRERVGGSRQKKALPVRVAELRTIVDTIDTGTLLGARDHALLLLGIVLYGRRSELTALQWSDITGVAEGMRVLVRRSKTDQGAVGEDVPVLWGTFPGTDPVAVLDRWREAVGSRGVTDGPILRGVDRHGRLGASLTGKSVNEIVQRRALLAGLPRGFSAHSLRAGGATIAHMNGAPIEAICRLGRWTPGSKAVLGYIRSVDEWRDHPFRGVL